MNQIQTTQPMRSPDIDQNKDIAALSYVWVLSVFIFFWKKDSPYVQFHAKQGMVLFGLSVVLWGIPVVGHLLNLVILALCVLGFLNAANGTWKALPIVGDIATGRFSHIRQSWKDIVHSITHLWRRHSSSAKKDTDESSSPRHS